MKWLGLQFKCSACSKTFMVGEGGFKVMKKRVLEHAEEHLEVGEPFEIVPTNPERAIGMRWQCSACKEIIRLNKAGLDDLRMRVWRHAANHAGLDDFRIIPIG